ncbi:hypothetical protein GOEFS_095_00560 [Gordonia effusa NBRC 100432]|uniref:Uncharacterized protein n=1 Tax=Gordonia effusa NBRC 100432 TaxID=1077974 RepID=H0R420_9ACTN|nr:hypothetical protein GOEFS_095_00560 [Gordonia effusa NBRC 100432]
MTPGPNTHSPRTRSKPAPVDVLGTETDTGHETVPGRAGLIATRVEFSAGRMAVMTRGANGDEPKSIAVIIRGATFDIDVLSTRERSDPRARCQSL